MKCESSAFVFLVIPSSAVCRILAAFFTGLVLAGCQPESIQRQFKLVEKWSSRWCADETHERLDKCKTSDGLNRLMGNVSALREGDGLPPMRIDRSSATRYCLEADPDARSNLNALLEKGAKVIARGEQMAQYSVRASARPDAKDYHLIQCHFRQVILEGPPHVITQGEGR